MTKKYIVLKEQIDTTDEYPISKGAATTAIAAKVNIAQGVAQAGKFLQVGSDGNVTLGTPDAQVQVDWNSDTAGDVKTIANRPFKSIGTGLTVTDAGALTADVQMHFEVFDELPTPSATYAQTIALILKEVTETGNIYKEYACVNTTGSTWVWEQIGETQFELNIVQNASGITINGTALQSATSGQKGLLTAADWATFNGKQDELTFDNAPTSGSTNPVTSGGVYTALDGKVAKETGKGLVETTKVAAYDAHLTDTENPHSVTKAQVGLGNVDNTSDANKPVSTAQQAALDGKVSIDAGSFSIGKDTNGYYFNE